MQSLLFTHVFLKVTVHIQHCAIINSEDFKDFEMIIGICSQDLLPFEFAMKDRKFTPNSKIASMSVTQFSTIGVARLKERLGFAPQLLPQLDYASLVFHKQLSRTVMEIAVMSVKALPAFQEVHFSNTWLGGCILCLVLHLRPSLIFPTL